MSSSDRAATSRAAAPVTITRHALQGFLGIGEKDVALPFAAVKPEKKDNKWYLTVDETKDSLKGAAGYKYDSSTTTWSPVSK